MDADPSQAEQWGGEPMVTRSAEYLPNDPFAGEIHWRPELLLDCPDDDEYLPTDPGGAGDPASPDDDAEWRECVERVVARAQEQQVRASVRRRARLDGAPGLSALHAVEQVLAGAIALTVDQARPASLPQPRQAARSAGRSTDAAVDPSTSSGSPIPGDAGETAGPPRPGSTVPSGGAESSEPTAAAADSDPVGLVDEFGDGLVAAFAAVRRVASRALWQELVLLARLVTTRAGRTRSLPRTRSRTRVGRLAEPDAPDALVTAEIAAEIAVTAGTTLSQAHARLDAASALIIEDRLPATTALLAQGLVDWSRVRAVLARTRDLDSTTRTQFETRLYATPGILGCGNRRFENTLDALLLALDAEAAEARRHRNRRARRIALGTTPEGSALLTATGPAEALTAAYNGLDTAARHLRNHGDPRTLDQIRHDLLITGCTSGYLPVPASSLPTPPGCISTTATSPDADTTSDDTGAGTGTGTGTGETSTSAGQKTARTTEPSSHGNLADHHPAPWFTTTWPEVTVTVHVTVSAETLMNLTDDTGTLHGYGPISAQAIRDLITNGSFRCLATDPDHGTVLGLGRTTFTPSYSPTPRLRDLLTIAHPTCTFPHCTRPTPDCDLDHATPHRHGGATCDCNVRPLCRTHHRLKTAGLIYDIPSPDPDDPPGTRIWIFRTGRAFTAYPHTPLPHFQPAADPVGPAPAADRADRAADRPGDRIADHSPEVPSRPVADRPDPTGSSPRPHTGAPPEIDPEAPPP